MKLEEIQSTVVDGHMYYSWKTLKVVFEEARATDKALEMAARMFADYCGSCPGDPPTFMPEWCPIERNEIEDCPPDGEWVCWLSYWKRESIYEGPYCKGCAWEQRICSPTFEGCEEQKVKFLRQKAMEGE